MELMQSGSVTLRPTSPFHFDGSVFNPSHFPSSDYLWKPGRYWQTLRWKGRTYGIRFLDKGTNKRPKVELTIYSRREPSATIVDEIAREVRWRFDLDSEGVPKFVHAFRGDQYVGPAIRRRPGMRPKSGYSLYEYLVITVMLQNTVVRRSVKMLQSLFEAYGQKVSFDGQNLWSFWDPKSIVQASERELRALKLGYRAKTLKRQAEYFAQDRIDELELRKIRDKEALAKKLDEIYGVGPQSSWYALSEFFHFYDAMEHISPWEGKIVGRILFGPHIGAQRVQKFLTARYGAFRDLAFYYLLTDLFWQHREQPVPWLTKLIRL